ncbi:undecaprenyl-diphosphate phosphatase [Eubacterium sp. AM05-23]|uniref:undecaprenyl-diphosphate phosphatase n=1 Tax=Eubacterium TaxID=1730 RepID=UPI000E490B5F|nr:MULTISPECIES: undecaprenyl-diphosphate phosphatase [Eubacterium]MBS6340411.1 undecaprenyl-diphosphate phosphatase [Eubacterium limosum]MDO5434027.1 undecaprenyl-diphosphate phosphatase [Eubacterium sp.]RHO61318.1 undecaprenyl-diphosphate phosphatase [Eubacterium sp. AM05-23]
MFLELLKAAFFGIVQGITEWLPISSTGHMILFEQFIHMNVSKDFWDMFLVVIQFGSILAVVLLYFHKLNPFSPKKSPVQKRDTWSLWGKVLVAVIPAAVIGLLFDDFITDKLYGYVTVAITLIVYGIAFIVVENMDRTKRPTIRHFEQLDYKTALFIGVFQILALIPGTSRSGSTIIGATLLGCSRYVATEFSFFLAVPVMLGASLLKIVKFFIKTGIGFTGTEIGILLVGMIVAFVVSVFAIKFLMGYIRKHDFKAFGYYRIVLGIIVIIYAVMFA